MIANLSQPNGRRGNKRVLAVVRHPVGGVRTHIVYTYALLMQAGYRFTFVIPDDKNFDTFRDDVSSWDKVQIVDVPYDGRRQQKPLFRPMVRRLLKRDQFCLIHSHGLQAAIPTIFANVGVGVPHVMTSQDVFDRVRTSGFVYDCKRYALAQLLRRLDVLITVSEDTREDHLRHLPVLRKGPCRLETIHNGIPIEPFTNSNGHTPANLRQRLSLSDGVFLMGFLGRFVEQKGFPILIDAIDQLISQSDIKPFHVVAVGSGDMLVNYRRRLAIRQEVSSRLSFLEHARNVAPILQELDLLVMPSLWEAHPLLPMEAMLAGLPVVGTSCLGLREVLRDSPSMVVLPGDAKELARSLRVAIKAPWKDAATEYIPKAKERFDVRHTADSLLRVFEELTS